MNYKIKIFSLIIVGILFSYTLFESYHFDNIFEIFLYVIFGGIGFYIFYNGIFDEIEKHNLILYPELIMLKGMLYDKLHNDYLAKKHYQQVLVLFSNKIRYFPYHDFSRSFNGIKLRAALLIQYLCPPLSAGPSSKQSYRGSCR